jgi:hypothetical protein
VSVITPTFYILSPNLYNLSNWQSIMHQKTETASAAAFSVHSFKQFVLHCWLHDWYSSTSSLSNPSSVRPSDRPCSCHNTVIVVMQPALHRMLHKNSCKHIQMRPSFTADGSVILHYTLVHGYSADSCVLATGYRALSVYCVKNNTICSVDWFFT